nr:family 43 glycosylhydrolase [uncultured Clostridium sp.]
MKMQAFNPYLPSYEYVADGEPHIFGMRLYIFGSHDLFEGEDFCLGDYVCWSAPLDDLGNWQYEGVIYHKEQDPRNTDGKMHMCAPDVVQGKDGRYYLYYQLHVLSITSVAVCDTPAGKYEFYGYVQHTDGIPWGEKKGDVFTFDPGVLLDDDGKCYLYVGFSPLPGFFKKILKLRGNNVEEGVCLELSDDMMTVVGMEMPVVPGNFKAKGTDFEGHGFFEASSPRKINGKYYLVYSSELSHELCYAISDYPNKEFHYGGTLVSIGNIGYQGRTEADNYMGNTHGGMVEVNGQWYIFYHRQTNLQKCARQGCAEKLTIQSDGTIWQAETTSCGLNRGPLDGQGRYEARIASTLTSYGGTFPYLKTREKNKKKMHPYFTQTGTDIEKDGNQYIANMRNGAEAGFRYFDMKNCSQIAVSVRGNGNGIMEIKTDRGKAPIVSIPIEASEQYDIFRTDMEATVNGTCALYFTFRGKGYIDFQWFELQ